MKQIVAAVFWCAFAGVAMSQTNRIDTMLPDAPALAKVGPHPVGVRTVSLTVPDRPDVLNATSDAIPTYDRPLTLEVWYPADLAGRAPGGTYENVVLRDGTTRISLAGAAVRDATPSAGPSPLVIVSHGYPGNRFLMSHFGENLASKGYVVASVDHYESTYDHHLGFASTLIHRSPDQLFVLDAIARLSSDSSSFLFGIVDAERAAIIGYSMGAYGAIITAGGGVTAASTSLDWAPANGSLASLAAGSEAYQAQRDPRLKAIVAIGPWGWNAGLWDAEGLAGITIPALFMAGSMDQISGYDPGIRSIFENAARSERSLLTFDNAGHNAAAPMPAPAESLASGPTGSFGHYADPVWSTPRMNNVAQHFVTAFLGRHLKGDATMAPYLDLPAPVSGEDVDWLGFAPNTARGLRLEHLGPAEK